MPHAVFQLEEFLEVAVERLDALSPAAVEPSALLAGEERRPFLAMQPLALASAPLHTSPHRRFAPPRLQRTDVVPSGGSAVGTILQRLGRLVAVVPAIQHVAHALGNAGAVGRKPLVFILHRMIVTCRYVQN